MTIDPRIERRVDRLENEVVAIYDLIRDETQAIRGTLDEHTTILGEHGRILGEHGRILGEHGRILNEHTQALTEILRRLPEPD